MKFTLLRLASIGLLALGTSAAAHAEIIDIKWSETAQFSHRATLPARKFIEVCGPLKQDQTIAWSFKADQAVNFNIHFHEGEKVTYPAKVDGAESATGQLKPAVDQDYCWMWSNKTDQPVGLTLTLQKAGRK